MLAVLSKDFTDREFRSIRFSLNFVRVSLCCDHCLNQLLSYLTGLIDTWKIGHISNLYFQDRAWLLTLTDITI
ncbi:hypothetical protein EQ82_22680 [Klebsiella pneumoniae]|nr:hypothetical protein EQ82_22680 [Klebsiella pneumoniae]OWR56408.1 hypothetical protein BLK78_24355 [Klebsiella pneumoniae]